MGTENRISAECLALINYKVHTTGDARVRALHNARQAGLLKPNSNRLTSQAEALWGRLFSAASKVTAISPESELQRLKAQGNDGHVTSDTAAMYERLSASTLPNRVV